MVYTLTFSWEIEDNKYDGILTVFVMATVLVWHLDYCTYFILIKTLIWLLIIYLKRKRKKDTNLFMHKQLKFAIDHTGVETYLNCDKNSSCISSIYYRNLRSWVRIISPLKKMSVSLLNDYRSLRSWVQIFSPLAKWRRLLYFIKMKSCSRAIKGATIGYPLLTIFVY